MPTLLRIDDEPLGFQRIAGNEFVLNCAVKRGTDDMAYLLNARTGITLLAEFIKPDLDIGCFDFVDWLDLI